MTRRPGRETPRRRDGVQRARGEARARDIVPVAGPPLSPTHPAFILVALVAAACVVTSVTFRMWDTDMWQHLVVGREIWRLGHVPTVHITSWPTWGQPDVTVSWLFRALLWPFWNAWGLWGAFAWRWITTLAAFSILVFTARRMGARGLSTFVVAAWAVLPYRQRSQLRPETLVAILFAIQLWIHESRRNPRPDGSPGPDHTRWLPLIALVWANAHISYWMGLAVQAIYALDAWWSMRRARVGRPAADVRGPAPFPRLVVIGLVSAAVSFINPAGWRALVQPFEYQLFWRNEPVYKIISELSPVYWSANLRNLLPLLVTAWPLLLLWRWRRRGFDLAETLLALLFLPLALSTQRFIGFLALVSVPFVARDLNEWIRSRPWPRWTTPAPARAAIAALLCVAGSVAEWIEPTSAPGFGLKPEWFPIAACDFMEKAGVRGRSFSHFYLAGYLLWRFYPERDRLPFMDIHQSGTREDRRLYAISSVRESAWRELDRKYRFDWVMLNRFRVEGDRSLDFLDADSTFALAFFDDNNALYVRRDGPMSAVAARYAYRVLRAGPGSAALIAQAANDSTRRPALRAEIARLISESPFHANGFSLEASLLMNESRFAEAREKLRATLAIDPAFPFANERLAAVAIDLGRPREAEDALRKEIPVQGRTPRIADLLARAHEVEHRLREQRRELAPEVARSPALRDSLRAINERLAPAAPIKRARLPYGPLMPHATAAR